MSLKIHQINSLVVDKHFQIHHTNITKPILLENNHIAIGKQLIQNNANKVKISFKLNKIVFPYVIHS